MTDPQEITDLDEVKIDLDEDEDTTPPPDLPVSGEPAGQQFTGPDGGGTLADEEPTEIAQDAGRAYPAGPEQQAVRIEREP